MTPLRFGIRTLRAPNFIPSTGRLLNTYSYFHLRIVGGDNILTRTPGDTRDNINEFIPTPEEVQGGFIANQALQEVAMKGMGLAIPGGAPVKVIIEAYTLYDYFNS